MRSVVNLSEFCRTVDEIPVHRYNRPYDGPVFHASSALVGYYGRVPGALPPGPSSYSVSTTACCFATTTLSNNKRTVVIFEAVTCFDSSCPVGDRKTTAVRRREDRSSPRRGSQNPTEYYRLNRAGTGFAEMQAPSPHPPRSDRRERSRVGIQRRLRWFPCASTDSYGRLYRCAGVSPTGSTKSGTDRRSTVSPVTAREKQYQSPDSYCPSRSSRVRFWSSAGSS